MPRTDAHAAEWGFTLVEVLVALGILSIAVLALLHVQGQSAAATSAVRDRLLAEIAAENILVETVAAPDDLVAGVTEGESAVAGQSWHWTQTIAATSDRDIKRIDVIVRGAAEDQPIAALTAFRGQR
jgi:general secretion pathway protein I